MDPCWRCEGKPISHTLTGKKTQRKPKLQPNPQTVLWQPQNKNHHIKRINKKTTDFFDLLTKDWRIKISAAALPLKANKPF
jgi:hypothetical protein